MAHTHAHSPAEQRTYFIDQLSTIGICGLLGSVAVILWWRKSLGLLADPFHLPVLLGGIALLIVVAVRAVTLFATDRETVAPTQDHHHHEHEYAHDHGHEHHHHHDHGHAHEHHDHGHEHAHAHEHAHDQPHEHAHDHGHDHGWNPIRFVFLLIPITLFFVRMPSQGFNSKFQDYFTRLEAGRLGKDDLDIQVVGKLVDVLGLQVDKQAAEEALVVVRAVKDSPADKAGIKKGDRVLQIARETDEEGNVLAKPEQFQTAELSLHDAVSKLRGKDGTKVTLTLQRNSAEPTTLELTRSVFVQTLGFKELDRAVANPFSRQMYEGMTVKLNGQFVPRSPTSFHLMRIKITCCGADGIPLNVVILLDPRSNEDVTDLHAMQWVDVQGQVSFVEKKDRRGEYATVLHVTSRADIRKTDPDPTPFLQ